MFLVDHAWTFKYEDALETLSNNPALLDRLTKLSEYSDKLDLPNQEEEKQE